MITRRDVLRSSVAAAAASLISTPQLNRRLSAQSGGGRRASGMQPFRIDFGKDAVADLHRRLDAMRWPDMPFDTNWSQGTNDRVLRELVHYWRQTYDWTAVQDNLNQLTHVRGPIAGEQVHCVLYTGKAPRRRFPLLMMHGWPGSFLEFKYAAPLLAQQGFDLVVPSLPGYAFSEPSKSQGMNTHRAAERMHLLMRELGYEHYGIQGGDWGALIGTIQAAQQPAAVVGLHLNFAPRVASVPNASPQPVQTATSDAPAQPRLRDDGYQGIQRNSPQSLGYALEDSPVGFLSWILWRYWIQSDHAPDADLWNTFKRDDILTTTMVYWLPRRVLSSLRLYWETFTNVQTPDSPFERVTVPTGYARFKGSVSRATMEGGFNLVQYTEPPRGGHYAALEQPELFATDVGAFFSML